MTNSIENKLMESNKELNRVFLSAKVDITDCWENPINSNDRITRQYIYSVDPETMAFAKAMFSGMASGTNSLTSVFAAILESDNYETFIKTISK